MKKMNIPSVSDLESLSTHRLADLLANVVMVLRRLPDVPLADVINGNGTGSNGGELIKDPGAVAARMRREPKKQPSAEIPERACVKSLRTASC